MGLEIRQLQMLQLEIAKEVKRICEANQLDYFLADGTLLGAVRHRGFIPWDDDMDIGMPRADYEKFLSCCAEQLDERFELQTWDTDDAYGLPFAKIRLRQTTMKEAVQPKNFAHNGIWLDIFPFLCTTSRRASAQKRMQLNLLAKTYMMKCGYRLHKITSSPVSKAVNGVLRLTALPFPKEKIKKKYISKIAELLDDSGDMLLECDGRFTDGFFVAKSIADSYTTLTFEDTEFQVPAGYRDYLTAVYGDYMQLPPEDQRGNAHQVVACGLDRSYEAYFK